MTSVDHDHHPFDSQLRDCHRQAVLATPWQLRARLQPRPAARQSPARLRQPLLLAGMLALLGVWVMLPQTADGPVVEPAARIATHGPLPPADEAGSADALGMDPDFYAWLASEDAGLLAME